jgi:Cft2 family RNA processing exonuclease
LTSKEKHSDKIIKFLLFIGDNPVYVNVFLFLFTIAYFTVGIDLGKEIATEKDEIGFFTATLSNSVHVDNSEILNLLERIPPEDGILPPIVYVIHTSDVNLFPPARSPPTA